MRKWPIFLGVVIVTISLLTSCTIFDSKKRTTLENKTWVLSSLASGGEIPKQKSITIKI